MIIGPYCQEGTPTPPRLLECVMETSLRHRCEEWAHLGWRCWHDVATEECADAAATRMSPFQQLIELATTSYGRLVEMLHNAHTDSVDAWHQGFSYHHLSMVFRSKLVKQGDCNASLPSTLFFQSHYVDVSEVRGNAYQERQRQDRRFQSRPRRS